MPQTNWDRITPVFMLLHNVPTWAFGIFRRILIMNKDLRVHTDRYDTSQIIISFITQVAIVTTPIPQTCHCALMFLERFHLCSIFNVDCKNTSFAVSNKKFSFSWIENHACKLITRICQASIHTWQLSCFCIPYLKTVRMHRYKAK